MKKTLFAAAALLAACQAEEGGGNGSAPDANAAAQPGRAAAKGGEAAKTNLLDALGGSADHATLANAVKAAGLTETLSGAQSYTIFAPTEAAFQKLPPGTVNGLLTPESKGRLVALLTSHIVPGQVTAEDLGKAIERGKGKAQLATVGGATLSFSKSGDSIVLSDGAGGEARLAGAGQVQSNGVIHAVDAVLQGR